MNKILEDIVKELNPVNDFDDIKFYNHLKTSFLAEKAKAQLKNLAFFLALPKHLARGGVVGGTVGAIGNYLAGSSPGEGFAYGAVMGAILDINQYMIRALLRYTREQQN